MGDARATYSGQLRVAANNDQQTETNHIGGQAAADGQRVATLTTRQRNILRFIVLGYSNEEIGRTLSLAEETIKSDVAAVFRTLGINCILA